MASSTPTSVRSEDDDTVLFTTASNTSPTETQSHGVKFAADEDVFDRTEEYGDAGRA